MEKLVSACMVAANMAHQFVADKIKHFISFGLCLVLLACHEPTSKPANKSVSNHSVNVGTPTTPPKSQNLPIPPAANFHVNTLNKYEYRTGYSGSYSYNYDVEYTENSSILGNCTMTGKYGDCEIENGDTVTAEAEWVDYGIMEVTDEDGNTYEMEVQ
ncbi:hypothetical protein [Kingella kingae]|nr:hypothetical protein [Kingella kingae]MDK4536461.1 hypothetical protein [Kingella kingae]MDK4538240.1 hypothetical protein [Kingella kingae]